MARTLVLLTLAGSLTACVTPSADPRAIRRLDPAALAQIEAARPGRPLSLDEVVALSRQGLPIPEQLEVLRTTATRHALTPSVVLRMKAQGVAPEVLDALAEAQERWARDEAAADTVRREQAAQAAAERARVEAYRRAWRDAGWNSSLYLNYGGPFGSPYYRYGRPWGHGGSGWGLRYGR
ncbi:hypothetical protein [Zoogloea sp.]|uniref:hypothetical protein n=1 Tax=Zoogloea sp. TaxID=49181 RepID=UPI00141692C7|nr:MAG: hypothetical protein F9K15_04255 [Zoogloea sp.]